MRRGQEFAAHNAPIVRGFAWHVYPDQATPGVLAGENPFSTGGPGGADVPTPPGVEQFWSIRSDHPGLHNYSQGRSYLVVTETDEAPAVGAGWEIEPARLDEGFQIDQRGDRSVRLVRIIRTAQIPAGPVLECEFQVDRP